VLRADDRRELRDEILLNGRVGQHLRPGWKPAIEDSIRQADPSVNYPPIQAALYAVRNRARRFAAPLAFDFSFALRMILRQKRRSSLGIGAVAFGVVALLLSAGFIEWIFKDMRESTIRSFLGHIQVVRTGFLDAGAADPFRFLLPDDAPERARLERWPGVQVVSPRLRLSGLISVGESTVSFVGEGVIPGKEETLSASLTITSGTPLSAADPTGIIVGQGLAQNLGVAPGQKVVLLANTKSGGVNGVETHVRGVFTTVSKFYDDSALRVPLPVAQQLLRTTGAHTWVVLLDDTAATDATVAALHGEIAASGLELVPWHALADFYKKTVALFSKQVLVVTAIIGIIIVLCISNTLIMSVLERTGEIGTSMALGVTRVTIMRRFVLEGVVLGILGGVIGAVVGIVLAYAISTVGIPMPPPPGMSRGYLGEILVTPRLVFDALSLAVLTTLAASLYPAWKASRMAVVDALRHNR
jgi:putative ABC transport system permease protein